MDSISLILSATAGSGPVALDDVVLCQPSMTLGNLVWNDADYNGTKDTAETGVAGLTVQLFNPGADNVIGGAVADTQVGANITTDAAGAYRFTNLSPGNYYVRITPPATTITTANVATTDNNVDNNNDGSQPGGVGTALFSPIFALAAGTESTTDADTDADTNTTIDFGLYSTVSVGNLVYFDLNNDGNYDFNEGLEGVLVQIYTQGSTVGVTPADGVAGDDNAGQDLIAAATPGTTGASTAVFSLRPTLSPSGTSENGFEGITDDGTDTRVDLTATSASSAAPALASRAPPTSSATCSEPPPATLRVAMRAGPPQAPAPPRTPLRPPPSPSPLGTLITASIPRVPMKMVTTPPTSSNTPSAPIHAAASS